MILKINLNLKCNFCGNKDDTKFYVMPVEEKTIDGSFFSNTMYEVVCKLCSTKKIIKFNLVEGD